MTAAPRGAESEAYTQTATIENDSADDEVIDLADIAADHPVKHVRLDLARLNVRELLSLGDVEDMARALGTDPTRLQSVLGRGDSVALDVAVVLAWIIGRKADPTLPLDDVRRFWQVELVGVGKSTPNPPKAPTTRRSNGRAGSSRTRA